jgi:hypothetical protein
MAKLTKILPCDCPATLGGFEGWTADNPVAHEPHRRARNREVFQAQMQSAIESHSRNTSPYANSRDFRLMR